MGECKYALKRIEHTSSSSCRTMYHCFKFRQYCVKQCKWKVEKGKKAESK